MPHKNWQPSPIALIDPGSGGVTGAVPGSGPTVDAATLAQLAGARRMWMIYVAVAADVFGDGLMIGAGASVSTSLGLVLAFGQVLADIPEGFAAILTFKANDVPRRRRLVLSASFFGPTVAAAVAAYFLLRGRAEAVQFTALAVTAGLFAVAASEDMIAEAHDTADDSRTSTVALISGFCLFVLVSAGLR